MRSVKKVHRATYAGYFRTCLLPGENRAAFQKLHQELIVEISPNGPLEDDCVRTLAYLLWRKQNLETLRVADYARQRFCSIRATKLPPDAENGLQPLPIGPPLDPEMVAEAERAAREEARKELRDDFKFVELGEAATLEGLMKDFDSLE